MNGPLVFSFADHDDFSAQLIFEIQQLAIWFDCWIVSLWFPSPIYFKPQNNCLALTMSAQAL